MISCCPTCWPRLRRPEATLASWHGVRRDRHLVAWTEPGAGCDLRGVRTKAVRDGDDWLITGQKTSSATASVATRPRPRPHRRRSGRSGASPSPSSWCARVRATHRHPAGQDGPHGLRHRRTVLRQRPGPARRPRRRGGPGAALLACRAAAAGPAGHRRRRFRRRPRRLRGDRAVHEGPQRLRRADHRLPEQPLRTRRHPHRGRGHRGVRGPGHPRVQRRRPDASSAAG